MDTDALEADLKAACGAHDYDRAATLVLEHYGEQLLSFLIARLRSQSDGQEAFSIFAEDLWVGLPRFAFRSSMRTWCYALARNAANRYATSPHQRHARNQTLSSHAHLSQLVDRVRSQTEVHKRTVAKERIRALRDRLEPDDQMLLVLRVDRGMAWRDLALVMLGDSDQRADADALEREAIRLRKRFERVKTELKRMMKEADPFDGR